MPPMIHVRKSTYLRLSRFTENWNSPFHLNCSLLGLSNVIGLIYMFFCEPKKEREWETSLQQSRHQNLGFMSFFDLWHQKCSSSFFDTNNGVSRCSIDVKNCCVNLQSWCFVFCSNQNQNVMIIDSSPLSYFLILSTHVKHDLTLNEAYPFARRCLYTYKMVRASSLDHNPLKVVDVIKIISREMANSSFDGFWV